MEIKEMKMDLAGRELKITNGPIATYATGYSLVSLGDTVIMANASMSKKGKEGASFFPLSVDYEENFFAAGKIKGSRFVKRPGRPSENSVMVSRMIDRPVRPLFPKGTTNEVQIICSALSIDHEVDPATTAMNAASMALILSGAPFEGPIGAVRIGYINEELVVNPTYEQIKEGKLDLVVSGTVHAVTMVEAAAKEVSEEVMLEALDLAHKHIVKICEFQLEYAKQFDIKPIEAEVAKKNEEAVSAVEEAVTADMLDRIVGLTKMNVKEKEHEIEEELFEKFAQQIEDETFSKYDVEDALHSMHEKNMRKNILDKEERVDGRKIDEVRPISVFLDVLPRTHGSALFQRGETMSLTVTTLGGPGDAQIVDTMEEDITKRYFHHYHFPPFATGDIKFLRGANRREIGHGDLGERALLPVLPDEADFPYTIWVASEIVRCNGSSSMAATCGSTLSMMAAGVPLKRPVSGIAMGLVMNKENGDYKILSDIQGAEDFAGDMDFKVTGTTEGITALQMDIKVKGLSTELLKEALGRAKEGRIFILDEMLKAIPEPRKELSKFAPLILNLSINPDLIKIVIGKGGETINKIIKECGVEVDINDEGLVSVTAPDQESGKKALDWIKELTYEPEVGAIFDGKVVKIMEFGAFVQISPGKDGLVHISELSNERVNRVEDVVKEGDTLKVKLLDIDDKGRYKLSHKVLLGPDGKLKGDANQTPEHEHKEIKHDDAAAARPNPMGGGERLEGTTAVRNINGSK